jgi:hypothetical protein
MIDEVANQRRRILKIGGHDHGGVAAAVVDAGGNASRCRSCAEPQRSGRPALAKRSHLERFVPAAVDEDESPVGARHSPITPATAS